MMKRKKAIILIASIFFALWCSFFLNGKFTEVTWVLNYNKQKNSISGVYGGRQIFNLPLIGSGFEVVTDGNYQLPCEIPLGSVIFYDTTWPSSYYKLKIANFDIELNNECVAVTHVSERGDLITFEQNENGTLIPSLKETSQQANQLSTSDAKKE